MNTNFIIVLLYDSCRNTLKFGFSWFVVLLIAARTLSVDYPKYLILKRNGPRTAEGPNLGVFTLLVTFLLRNHW